MEVSNSHHQVMAAHQLEQVLAGLNCPKHLDPHQQQQQQQQKQQQGQQQEKKVRPPNPEQALKCPRCDSSNTKFCYYNNYSLSQPRYFCKGCRRYWTQGGSLRNVPVGGGCRKNKRSSSSSSSSSASKNKPHPLATTANNSSNPVLFPPLSYDPSDLSLAFTSNLDNNAPFLNPNPNPNPSAAGFLDILRGGGGFQNGYANNASSYYFDDQACANVLPPFEGANNLDGTTSAAAATAAVEGSWINHGINVDVDSTRGYWNGGVGSYWHGLINSSLM